MDSSGLRCWQVTKRTTWFADNITDKLQQVYQKLKTKEELAAVAANMEMHHYAQELAKVAAEAAALKEQEADGEDRLGTSSAEPRQLRDSAEEEQPKDSSDEA